MKRFNSQFGFFFILLSFALFGCTNQPKVYLFDGSEFRMDDDLNVFIFLSPECPICQKYQGSWKSDFRNVDNVYYVFPGKFEDSLIKNYIDYDSIPKSNVIIDSDFVLCKKIGAKVTPQAIVMQGGKIQYHGLIDDRFMELGSSKPAASVNFVLNALNSLKNNEKVIVNHTEAVGCLIEPR